MVFVVLRRERRSTPLTPFLLLALLFSSSIACDSSSSPDASGNGPATTRTCQALVASRYRGAGLPPKTIALTFDDGPGARTLELSHYLKNSDVPAAFFIVGSHLGADGGGAILQEIVADGHVIANHTQTHDDLTTLTASQIVKEVDDTDALIAPYVPNGRFMFRPPYGAYTESTFQALQASPMKKYVGPIDWDIGSMMGPDRATDWDCWSAKGASNPAVIEPKACGDLYLSEIRAKSSGIVLLHDPYFIDDDPAKGGTVDMIKYMLPILKAEGFTFVRVDNVPAIAADLPPLPPPPPPPPPPGPAPAPAPSVAVTPGQAATPPSPSSGDSSEPCPASPQQPRGNSGESGNLRNP